MAETSTVIGYGAVLRDDHSELCRPKLLIVGWSVPQDDLTPTTVPGCIHARRCVLLIASYENASHLTNILLVGVPNGYIFAWEN